MPPPHQTTGTTPGSTSCNAATASTSTGTTGIGKPRYDRMINNSNTTTTSSSNRKMRRTRESTTSSPTTPTTLPVVVEASRVSASTSGNTGVVPDATTTAVTRYRNSSSRRGGGAAAASPQLQQLSMAYDDYTIRGDTASAYPAFAMAAAEDVMTTGTTDTTDTSTTGQATSSHNTNATTTTTAATTTTTAAAAATNATNVTTAKIRYNRFLLSELMMSSSRDPHSHHHHPHQNPPTKPVKDVLRQMNHLESNGGIPPELPVATTVATLPMSVSIHIDTYRYYGTYNRALVHYGISDYTTAIQLCEASIRHPIQQLQVYSKSRSSSSNNNNANTGSHSSTTVRQTTRTVRDSSEIKEPVPIIFFHLAFLLLECVLALGVGRNYGLNHLLQINLTNNNVSSNINNNKQDQLPFRITIEMILDWLEDAMSTFDDTENDTPQHHQQQQQQQHTGTIVEQAQIKFLIPMYKSRIALSEFQPHKNNHIPTRMDHSTRSARKDMKTAMEIFHNKLRPSYTMISNPNKNNNNNNNNINVTSNETDSIASSVNSNDERPPRPSVTTTTTTTSYSLSPLAKYNQSALCVKAHLEQLKGNTKKSLILCTEAAVSNPTTTTTTTSMTSGGSHTNTTNSDANTVSDDAISTSVSITTPSTTATTASWYDAIHANNLAVIYATNGRKHLALHGMIKALRANTTMMMTTNDDENASPLMATDKQETPFSNLFQKDGTVKSDISTSLLYNTAICCLRTRNYVSAYECMVSCICHNHHHVFHNRTRCYLYLSDACIGMYSRQTKNDIVAPQHKRHIQALVEVNGYVSFFRCTFIITNFVLYLTTSILSVHFPNLNSEPKGIILDDASFRNDTAKVKEETLEMLGSAADLVQVERNPLLRARSCLQYVLQAKDNSLERDAIVSARLALCYVELAFGNYHRVRETVNTVFQELQNFIASDDTESENIRRWHKRQMATATMYLSEANCALGDVNTAMKSVLGDGTDDTLNQLASHLSGVTMEQASKNESAQRRLAKAQSTVRSSAAVLTAAMGHIKHAKELAQSAKTMEDEHFSYNDDSTAQRSMIYTHLCENNPTTALAKLLS